MSLRHVFAACLQQASGLANLLFYTHLTRAFKAKYTVASGGALLLLLQFVIAMEKVLVCPQSLAPSLLPRIRRYSSYLLQTTSTC
jgi:hypothetical protein